MLEIALICEKFSITPAELGLDSKDPRILRAMRVASNVYTLASAHHNAKDKAAWEKANPDGMGSLRWARNGETEHPAENEYRFALPERPRGR